MKIIINILMVSLVINSGGCMTYSAVQKAKGEDNVVTGDHPAEPAPAYYALMPITVPLDVATSPFQLLYYVLVRNSAAPL